MFPAFAKFAAVAAINALLTSAAFAAACATGTEDDFTYRGDVATSCEAGSGNPGSTLAAFSTTYTELVKFALNQNDATVGTIYWGTAQPFGTAPDNGTIQFGLKYLGLGADQFYSYELLVVDSPESLLPGTMDLLGMVKQANGYQAYEFDAALVGDTGNLGTFKSLFGPNANNAFSHFSIYGTNYRPEDGGGPPQQVPEPAPIAMMGIALAGLAFVRRREKSK